MEPSPKTPRGPGSDERLRKEERLHSAAEFRRVFDRGSCFRSRALRVHYQRTERAVSRLGLVVSRRVGGAVQRNRVKRLLREVFRRNKTHLQLPMDIVLVPQGGVRTHGEYLEAFLAFAARVRAPKECAKP